MYSKIKKPARFSPYRQTAYKIYRNVTIKVYHIMPKISIETEDIVMDLKEYSTAETVDVKSIPAEVYDIIAQILIREYTEQFYEEDEQVAVW